MRYVILTAILLFAPGTAFTQTPQEQSTVPADADTRGNARADIESQGSPSLGRLEGAMLRRTTEQPRAPVVPPSPDPALRRRAFDAIKTRARLPQIDARAKSALEQGHAALEEQRAGMVRRLSQALGLDAPSQEAMARAAQARDGAARVPLLFVSSSMPLATLRTYAAQLEKVGGVLAFRGMPGGLTKVEPMARLTAQILRLDPGCEGPACLMRAVQLIVDPILFRQHGVTRVPALAMIPGDPAQPYCEREEDAPRAAHLVLGDAALSGMLEEYARLSGSDKEVHDAQSRLENR